MNDSLQRRLIKLAKRYIKAAEEYKRLKQLYDSKPFLTEEGFRKIEARMARLNKECDHFDKEIQLIKHLSGEVRK
ncbi:hypothetical protein FOI68_03550 [Brevibacillus sp. LEMMJ03]|jgi:hypothetical protein|nr:hypothetical protein FOI68_03550 [Brevibacillus sp. LEMMJ03]